MNTPTSKPTHPIVLGLGALALLGVGVALGMTLATPPAAMGYGSPARGDAPIPDAALTGAAEVDRAPAELRPSFGEAVEPHPAAARLCDALHALPARARARCEGHDRPAFHMGERCTAVVSAALAAGHVRLDAARVGACVAALGETYASCAPFAATQVGAQAAADVNARILARLGGALPKACGGLFDGALEVGFTCRSSLECRSGLQCFGAGPMDEGRCVPPGVTGASCHTAVDTLAAHARQNDVEQTHPVCEGWCNRSKCVAPLAAGAACASDAQCGSARCAAGVCG
jgi:hypothetical protein